MTTIAVAVHPLLHIGDAVKSALLMAREKGVVVTFEFNGHIVEVSPDDVQKEIVEYYFNAMHEKQERERRMAQEASEKLMRADLIIQGAKIALMVGLSILAVAAKLNLLTP